MKIGIMGGTFDPIHNGHLMLGVCAYDHFTLDEIWFLPNGNPPHKSGETDVNDRLEMVKLAISSDARFRLNTYETERKTHSYSYETLEEFRKMYPEHEFYFIIGADSLFSIESWRKPERVLRACTILAACRDDKSIGDMNKKIAELTEKYGAQIELLKAPLMDVSSSDIRRMAAYGMSVESLVPHKVSEYMKSHELYKKGN